MTQLRPPQLVANSRMLYFGWVPADPEAARRLLPPELRAQPNSQVFMNTYEVDREEYTSHFGAYNLTYLGVDVRGLDVSEVVPARWWTHYWSSSAEMSEYVKKVGTPARPGGRTVLELKDGVLVATLFDQGRAIIRTTATVGPAGDDYVRSHLRYITKAGDSFYSGHYPAIGRCARDLKFTELEFLDKSHDVYALRPKDPLEIVWGFYFTSAAFCYPHAELLTREELANALAEGK
ncbi:hypothetical protein [Bradyrhizobium mercantei]|uniref:hypothetical protein n=1 Tax=Bradyrhizobium mercantei TaxID=1904807 RepID=UPI00097722D5|nr:hypothetical protein [Bradyrhizobium mercantei]